MHLAIRRHFVRQHMNLDLDCIPCFVRNALAAARFANPDTGVHEQTLREALQIAAARTRHSQRLPWQIPAKSQPRSPFAGSRWCNEYQASITFGFRFETRVQSRSPGWMPS